MTDLYHPLYLLGDAAFVLAGGLIGYSIGFRGGSRDAIDEVAKLACAWCRSGQPLAADGKTHEGVPAHESAYCWSIEVRALKGGRS